MKCWSCDVRADDRSAVIKHRPIAIDVATCVGDDVSTRAVQFPRDSTSGRRPEEVGASAGRKLLSLVFSSRPVPRSPSGMVRNQCQQRAHCKGQEESIVRHLTTNAGSRWRRFVVISANRGACGTVDGLANPRGCEEQKTRGPQSACSRFDWRRRQSFSTAQLTRGWSPFRGSTRPRLHGIGGRRAASECSLDAESSGTSRRDALLSVVRKDHQNPPIVTTNL